MTAVNCSVSGDKKKEAGLEASHQIRNDALRTAIMLCLFTSKMTTGPQQKKRMYWKPPRGKPEPLFAPAPSFFLYQPIFFPAIFGTSKYFHCVPSSVSWGNDRLTCSGKHSRCEKAKLYERGKRRQHQDGAKEETWEEGK